MGHVLLSFLVAGLLFTITIIYHSFSVHPIIALGTSILLLTNTTFTYGETSGAVHHEILNISSISGAEFASLVLQPIPKDRDVIRIANTQAIIKITVHSKNQFHHR